jgi:hypothetical protein
MWREWLEVQAREEELVMIRNQSYGMLEVLVS